MLATSLSQSVDQFYPLSQFKLFKRSPLPFPDYTYCSSNYFNPLWSGARRIKNVVMILDWVPDPAAVSLISKSYEPLSTQAEAALNTAISLFDTSKSSYVDEVQLNQVCYYFSQQLN